MYHTNNRISWGKGMREIFQEFRRNLVFFIIIDFLLWATLFIGYLKPLREKYPIRIDKLTFNKINDVTLTKKLEDVEKRVFLNSLDHLSSINEYATLNDTVTISIYREKDTFTNEKWVDAWIKFTGFYDSQERFDEFLNLMVSKEQLEKNKGYYNMGKNDSASYPCQIGVFDNSKFTITFYNNTMPYTHDYRESTAFGSGKAIKSLKSVIGFNEYFLTIERINVRKTVFRDILENLKIIGIVIIVDMVITIWKVYQVRRKVA